MLALPQTDYSWRTLNFVSTLYIRPFVDQLVAELPLLWQPEVRLGLHEALINASRHGNQMDPGKQVLVHYSHHAPLYQWVIQDQGCGFSTRRAMRRCQGGEICEADESGRGIFILTQIFDTVEWNDPGNRLLLRKVIDYGGRRPLII